MKRIVLAILALFLFLLTPTALPPAHAQQAQFWRFSSWAKAYDACDKGELNADCYGSRWTSNNMVDIGCGVAPVMGLCTEDENKYKAMIQGSMLGMINRGIYAMFTVPPANTYAFLMDTGQSLGFIRKSVYAQANATDWGIGFSGLTPILPLWRAFRNIAYMLLTGVMIIIGLMIMFRKKIDPHTVVNVQNALPRIVVTLILITFSYAIVGIVIDLMYLSILFTVKLFYSTGLLPELTELAKIFGRDSWEEAMTEGSLGSAVAQAMYRINPWHILGISWDQYQQKLAESLLTGGGILAILFGSGIPLVGPAMPILGGILALGIPVFYLLLTLMLIFLFIRLLFFFTSCYIQIILSLLFGPIQILMGAIPGNDSFSNWFKNLVANVIVFPVGAVMFMLSSIFSNIAYAGGDMWAAPYVGIFSSVPAISSIIALGLLFTIPNIAGSIKEAMKTKPFVNAGPGAIFGPMGSGAGQLLQLGYQLKFISAPHGGRDMAHTTPKERMEAAAKGGNHR